MSRPKHSGQHARRQIDAMLAAAGWDVQDRSDLNLAAAPGVAVREFQTRGGPADYLLFLGTQLVGVIEAKQAGVTLSSIEAQTRDYAAKVSAACRCRCGRCAEPRGGIDEKAIAKGHKYMTLVYDITNRTVEYIGDGRARESLLGFYDTLSPVQLAGIQAVAMDMWSPYVNATLECVPRAETKIVFDRFHIMQHMNKAVDKVRRDEHRQLLAMRDQTLTGSRFLWLYGVENVPQHRWRDFELIRARAKKTARAWSIKETLRELWRQPSVDLAITLWRRWYAWARRSRRRCKSPTMADRTTSSST